MLLWHQCAVSRVCACDGDTRLLHGRNGSQVRAACRPPLLGFKHLQPRFGINMRGHVGNKADETALPTASTCFNLLKLPPFRSPEMLRDKLLLAIEAGTGFELS